MKETVSPVLQSLWGGLREGVTGGIERKGSKTVVAQKGVLETYSCQVL